jgi:pimeloyl-ACP methyl ester carboxylesterase
MKTLTVNGVRLATVDRGSGPPVLLVHGFPLDHSMWEGQIEALSGRFRVIAPDLRGFGQSGERCLPSFPDTITMDQFADDLAALVDALGVGGPVVLCGLSMGGYIAFAFCRKYPARLRGLILCDTRAAADAPEAAAGRLETAERVLREGPGFVADSMLPKLLAPDTLAGRPEIVAAVRKVILATDPRGIAAALRGMRERPDSTPLLAQIACPTLVVVGQEDGLSPPETMQALARQIPNSRFVTIPGAGHLSPVEQPAATTAAITGFLDSLA